jgi:hypothetical protein
MTLDFLLKAFRRALQKNAGQNRSEPAGHPHRAAPAQTATADQTSPRSPAAIDRTDNDPLDPYNPFPDPLIIEFTDVLDLHSIPPKQVGAVMEDYLEEAHRRGFRYLRIIHGKGLGVQREMVRSLLARTAFVVEFHDAPAEAGGWGATLVTMREEESE